MINTAYKTKLLNGHSLTHIAIGLQQQGVHGEIFKIGVLTSKSPINLQEIVKCTTSSDSGLIFVGKVLDPNLKPCMMTINRGTNNQIVVGPNRMLYSPDTSEELRIALPDNYQMRNISQTLGTSNDNLIEFYMMPATDYSF